MTNTLPVKKSEILFSKILSGIIFILVSSIIVICEIIVIYYSKDNFELIKQLLENISLSINISKGVIVFGFIAMLLLLYTTYMNLIFTGITLGHIFNSQKILLSLVFTIILYSGIEIGNLLGLRSISNT